MHGIGKRSRGQEVHKYVGNKDAAAQLTDSIRKGGFGKWGPVTMPAQPALSEGDAKTLAEWVLSGAK